MDFAADSAALELQNAYSVRFASILKGKDEINAINEQGWK